MSQKQDKKLRQIYRRDLGKKLETQVNEFKEELGSLLKPAPKFIPEFIWVKLQQLFLNV